MQTERQAELDELTNFAFNAKSKTLGNYYTQAQDINCINKLGLLTVAPEGCFKASDNVQKISKRLGTCVYNESRDQKCQMQGRNKEYSVDDYFENYGGDHVVRALEDLQILDNTCRKCVKKSEESGVMPEICPVYGFKTKCEPQKAL